MPGCFFDTSAAAKLYHSEPGSREVQRIADHFASRRFLSSLSVVEMQSVFALKTRTNAITAAVFQVLRRQFFAGLTHRYFELAEVDRSHHEVAGRLIAAHGLRRSLRTLDALQLAVALDLRQRGWVTHLVATDHSVCRVGATEGLVVLNPDQPSVLLS